MCVFLNIGYIYYILSAVLKYTGRRDKGGGEGVTIALRFGLFLNMHYQDMRSLFEVIRKSLEVKL